MKLWGGRFQDRTADTVDHFNSSLNFDFELYPYDIRGSRVHVKMLARQQIISEEEKEEILTGLDVVEKKLDAVRKEGKIPWQAEDIHTLIEKLLSEEIGSLAGKMHTARSRNDQVALDIRLYLREQIDKIQAKLIKLLELFCELAARHLETLMPGFTHFQPAQPVTLAHHLLAHAQRLKRDLDRLQNCRQRVNVSPLGAGALAATTFNIDRQWTAEKLGFTRPSANSLDAVGARDFLLEFHHCSLSIMLNLSSLAEEIIIWNSPEYNFIELDDSVATGSSIMPQKKNPDIAELVRSKTGRLSGNYQQLAMVIKGLPLAYNKDLQEDKESLFDSVTTVKEVLEVLPVFLRGIKFNREKMRESLSRGYLNATELADYLSSQGLPFRESHKLAGKAVNYALSKNKGLEEMSLTEFKDLFPEESEKLKPELLEKLLPLKAVENRTALGGPAPSRVAKQLENLREELDHYKKG